MRPERWLEIEDLVQSAIDCAPADRPALLRAACGDDVELRREVESLLAMHEDGGFTRSSGFADAVKVLEQHTAKLNEGRSIGTYRVLREIGRGGMGTVYLAARADDAFQKLVAIKLLRRGLDTDDIVQRFRGERQILAMLDHPNIARLLDGGTTDDGLPYFVMEHIEGEPINLYCDRRGLTVTERLKLFQGVCAAVRYAHQNLVIHRDIKPCNVLVTKEGVPRLLDFGIAKLLVPGTSPEEMTRTGLRPLTPQYASPEQIRGEPITTASDVYSLGVLLYELLSGKKPYPLGHRDGVEDDEPERPSIAAGSMTGRHLRGDVDNIVLMAMRHAPHRRYGSVEQFRRYPPAHGWIAGHRWPGHRRVSYREIRRASQSGSRGGGVAGCNVIRVITTAWQARLAAAQRDRARIEAAKAERINTFLQDMLSFSSAAMLRRTQRKTRTSGFRSR